jgi:Flp pilus assembly protein TadG
MAPQGASPASSNSRACRLLCNQQGQSLLESALTISLLLTLLLGTMQVGLMLYAYHFVSYAAREGTRYAIVRGSTSCSSLTMNCNASASAIQSFVGGLGFPGVHLSSSNITVQWADYASGTGWSLCNSSNTSSGCSTANAPGNQVKVTVSYQFPFTVPFVPVSFFTLNSTSAMVIAQ